MKYKDWSHFWCSLRKSYGSSTWQYILAHRSYIICFRKSFWMGSHAEELVCVYFGRSAWLFKALAKIDYTFVFSIWVFFHEHSRFLGQQGKGKGLCLTPLYHFHLLHRHSDISRVVTAESSHLRIASSRTRTGNLWFPSESH